VCRRYWRRAGVRGGGSARRLAKDGRNGLAWLLVDIRGTFLRYFRIDDLLCEDGIHPNSKRQNVITETFLNFSRRNLEKDKIIYV
jgi:hypothetical protein